MNNVKIQDKFSFLKENEMHKNIVISEDKITFSYSSFARIIFGVLFMLYGGPIFVCLVYLSLEKHNIIPAFSIDFNTLSIILTIIALFFILISSPLYFIFHLLIYSCVLISIFRHNFY